MQKKDSVSSVVASIVHFEFTRGQLALLSGHYCLAYDASILKVIVLYFRPAQFPRWGGAGPARSEE